MATNSRAKGASEGAIACVVTKTATGRADARSYTQCVNAKAPPATLARPGGWATEGLAP